MAPESGPEGLADPGPVGDVGDAAEDLRSVFQARLTEWRGSSGLRCKPEFRSPLCRGWREGWAQGRCSSRHRVGDVLSRAISLSARKAARPGAPGARPGLGPGWGLRRFLRESQPEMLVKVDRNQKERRHVFLAPGEGPATQSPVRTQPAPRCHSGGDDEP